MNKEIFMRSIKFKRYHFNQKGELLAVTFWGRGIDIDGQDVDNPHVFIAPSSITSCVTFADCQYIGVNDKHLVDVYEGDSVKVKGVKGVGIYETEIICTRARFQLKENKTIIKDGIFFNGQLEVIGHIYEDR